MVHESYRHLGNGHLLSDICCNYLDGRSRRVSRFDDDQFRCNNLQWRNLADQ